MGLNRKGFQGIVAAATAVTAVTALSGLAAASTPGPSTPGRSAPGTASSAQAGNLTRYVVANHSGKCLTVLGASHANNALVNQYRCVGAKNQQWRLEMAGGGAATLADAVLRNVNSGKCLTVLGGSTAKGAKLTQYTCVGAANQTFAVKPLLLKHTQLFAKPLSGTKCVDVQGGSKADNAAVLQWSCNNRENQKWDLTRKA
ncbi:RICIN domain-containing protein [Streptomyces monticola]|uniref:RICIN domain-containing protein n=1 Tax=Streptomyces monticola TaxID=2666263 RepID=A0ABW2JPN5_9ACTN